MTWTYGSWKTTESTYYDKYIYEQRHTKNIDPPQYHLRKKLMYLIALTEPGYACVGGRSTGNPAHYHRNALYIT
jgi:hypothetical protein